MVDFDCVKYESHLLQEDLYLSEVSNRVNKTLAGWPAGLASGWPEGGSEL